ncbi:MULTISPECIES: phosphoenolpyruvate mutase [Treponema]|uniref:phosphoenolpyruvate mutase n=1 Tax=Treponema denticola (strain ATCC 35405 / DSM 14222 / CIP 103919 / JCM 8153 / KCTC 15104) TaxID=243275 RepID=Q73MU4_TREDE|nr:MULTISPECIES: phosphoenolpyruvate mutase [Treponema]AAS11930.1 cytidylyltransferase/phosphoenolpyruvate phosphomutase, putative [Treponema denticola ATCC 35405]EMB37063.1 phosphoenolpyruvate phosphomutase [Treponema denticola ATCC 33521]EMB41464.1 phosphoenolpyruvate phosphomutase [Treponema denticola ATCC 35404]HCY96181.1 phosphoenolpyruvate mutase [Treponema sp.]
MEKRVYLGLTADIIHPGIINIINEGAKHGQLIIGLLTDSAIVSHKRLPYLTYEQRKQVVENIKGVSKVVPQEDWSYIPNLKKLKPDFIIHGDDWKSGSLSKIRDEVIEVMKEWGGEVIEVPYTKGINSSALASNMHSIGTTPEIRMKTLRRLIEAKPIVRIMEAHSGLSGLIIENLEVQKDDGVHRYDGMWSSSLTDSTSKGKPDIEAVDLTTRLQGLTDILECTTKPIIFDGDTGGKTEHFVFTVRTLERNGVSAIIIEDKVGLKKNSLFGTEAKQELADVEDFCHKISEGKKAQVTKDFMIIARLESLIAGHSVDEALERAFAYVKAGADGVMIHSKEKHGNDIKEFCERFRKEYEKVPIVLVPTTYNQFTEKELASWGANIIIYANHMLRASYPAMLKAAQTILEAERSLEVNDMCLSIKQILELIPGTK